MAMPNSCQHRYTRTLDSRFINGRRRRTLRCNHCKKRISTVEIHLQEYEDHNVHRATTVGRMSILHLVEQLTFEQADMIAQLLGLDFDPKETKHHEKIRLV